MTDATTRIVNAERARAAMDEFVGPVFGAMRAEYIERLTTLAAAPLTNDARAGIEKLALAIKVVDGVRAQVEHAASDAGIARAEKRRAEQIEAIPAEKRAWLGL